MTQYVLNLDGDITSLTQDLVNIPSVSGNEAAISDAIESALRKYPWLTVERYKHNVIARTNFGKDHRVIIAGHVDTVPENHNTEAILVQTGEALRGSAGTADEPLLYGLGSCDMKGGVAVALRTAATASEPRFDVTYIFYECEEVDSVRNGLTHIAKDHPEWLAGEIAILLEPSNSAIEAGCQGTLRAQVRTTGVRSHSARSWKGENAIHKLSDALRRLNDYQAAIVPIDGLNYREGLNAVGVFGGVAGNVIPDAAYLEVNYRYAPSKSAAEAEEHVRGVFEGYEVEFVDNMAGAMPGLTRPALADLVARVDGVVAPKFGWTDVGRFSAMGVPAVNLGPGDPNLAHSQFEHVPVAQLESCAALVYNWVTGA